VNVGDVKISNFRFEPQKIIVSLSDTMLMLDLKTGDTKTITATVSSEDGTYGDIIWSSSDEKVATVDSNGVVTAVSVGTATITATENSKGMNASCTVTVIHTYTTPGDVNNDTKINITDLMLVLNHVSGKKTLTGTAFDAADVTGDGNVDLKDLMKLLNYVSGKITTL
jgi:uncharacterized protein YjdB